MHARFTQQPRRGAWLVVGGLVALAALAACSRKEPAPEPVRAVKLLEVGATPRETLPEYAGDVRARVESRLGFRVAGKLVQRQAEVGQHVAAGQLLAQLDGQDYALAAQAAQAQVAAATTQRDLAAADFQRFSALKAQNFISGAELDRRAATLKSAQASLDQAKAQAATQSNQSGYTQLLADAAGVVTAVEAEPGQVVAAGAPVVRIARDGERDAVFVVPEDRRSQLRIGQPMQVRPWPEGAPLAGVVREVAASADPATRTYAVKVAIQGQPVPPLGATIYVLPQVSQGSSAAAAPVALKLPTTALRQQGGGSAVWVFDPATSTVRSQAVTVASADGNEAIIAAGLTSGQQVVATGVHVLTEGQKVSIYQPARTSEGRPTATPPAAPAATASTPAAPAAAQ